MACKTSWPLWGQRHTRPEHRSWSQGHCQQLHWELRSGRGHTRTVQGSHPPLNKQMHALGPATYPTHSWAHTLLSSLRIIPKRLLGILQLKAFPEQKYTACASRFQHLTTPLNAFNLLVKPMEPKELLMGKCLENVNNNVNIKRTLEVKMHWFKIKVPLGQ